MPGPIQKTVGPKRAARRERFRGGRCEIVDVVGDDEEDKERSAVVDVDVAAEDVVEEAKRLAGWFPADTAGVSTANP